MALLTLDLMLFLLSALLVRIPFGGLFQFQFSTPQQTFGGSHALALQWRIFALVACEEEQFCIDLPH